MSPQSLSIFFPMYNEKKNIEHTLAEAETAINDLGFGDYEILIINDGSRDGCDQLVEARARTNHHLRLIHHPHNLGYGAALRTGFINAGRDLVFYTDCDLPADLHDIQRALELIKGADLVIGYRIKRHETLRRAVFSRIYNLLMRLLFGVRVRDVNCSFKLVHKSVLDKITLTASTVFIDGQLLAEAVRYGFKIAEIPIVYTPRRFGRSNFDSLHTAWKTLTEMLHYWVDCHTIQTKSLSYPFK
jgi:glycosyltransferase involved in cell wall biosynthesis